MRRGLLLLLAAAITLAGCTTGNAGAPGAAGPSGTTVAAGAGAGDGTALGRLLVRLPRLPALLLTGR